MLVSTENTEHSKEEENDFSTKQLLSFASQIARGMVFMFYYSLNSNCYKLLAANSANSTNSVLVCYRASKVKTRAKIYFRRKLSSLRFYYQKFLFYFILFVLLLFWIRKGTAIM